MHQPPPPDARTLLPPLLACLPTAFASLRPPPALLPILSPVLRQRVTFLTANDNPRSDGWLPLLSWDGERGAKLPEIVERMQLEPHPVSGELEMDDVRPAKYRRLDEETLNARLEVEQFEILPIYVWCDSDEHGGTGPGWKLSELRALEDLDDGLEWFDTVSEANDIFPTRTHLTVPGAATSDGQNGSRKAESVGTSDDDAYWAAYDQTPGRTPAAKQSPAPQSLSTFQRNAQRQRSQSELDYFARYTESPAPQPLTSFRRQQTRQRSQSEFDYFSRYGNEVQPAMDGEDPDEKHELAQTNHNTSNLSNYVTTNDQTHSPLPQPIPLPPERTTSRPSGTSLYPADAADTVAFPAYDTSIPAPRPISPASSSHSSIERLEQRARAISEAQSQASEYAQTAIKQHISTDIKSLFRLARNTGIERREFERLVGRELECLGMLEEDD